GQTRGVARGYAGAGKGDVMGRVKEQPRGRLAVIQDLLSGGGRALVDGAQVLSGEMQRRLVEVGDGVEGQVATLIGAVEERLTDLGREVGTKLGELGALRERLTRMEGRVVESSKDQITRAGETAGLRDRLTRLESRLGDLSKEQLARAVESAGLRERLFR